ncbi:MAG: tandem-95 repeat protein [Homoserinimonas sp.]|nr:tandem-95 repeat protein [Homoserinimonas sp.]
MLAVSVALALTCAGLAVPSSDSAAEAAVAGDAFSCSEPTFFAMTGGGSSQLYAGRYLEDGTSGWTKIGPPSAANYNALAFDEGSRLLYGVAPNGTLYSIDSTGAATSLGNSTPALGAAPATLWDSGEIDAAGTYYVANQYNGGTTIHKIANIASGPRTRTTLTLQTGVRFADITFKDGYLWAHNYNQNTDIYRIDVSTGAVTVIPSTVPIGAYGAAFTMNNGNLAFISATTLYQVEVKNPTGSMPTTSIINEVAAPANSQSDATNCRVNPVDLVPTVDAAAFVPPGGQLTWTVTIHNAGPGASSGFVVKNVLPAGVTNVTVTASGAACAVGSTITCNGGALAGGADAVVIIKATAPASGELTNTVTVTGNEADDGREPNTVVTTTKVGQPGPVAFPDVITTAYQTAADIAVLANDTATAGVVTVTNPADGTVVVNSDMSVKYTPDAGFSGEDSFSYTVTDSANQTSSALVTVTVTPLAVNDSASTRADTSVDVAVLTNDKGQALSVSGVSHAVNGSVVLTGNVARFSPTAGFSGTATFDYLLTGAGGTSSATVSVRVSPVATDDIATTAAGTDVIVSVLGNDVGTNLTVSAAMDAKNGAVAIVNGEPVFTPTARFSGAASFSYTAEDADGHEATAAVTIQVTPVAVNDAASTSANTAVTVAVLTNDAGTHPHVTLQAAPARGTVILNADGTFTYTPERNISGLDTFTYTLTADGGISTATVSIVVQPSAPDDVSVTAAGSPVEIDVLANDSGTGMTIVGHTAPAHGAVIQRARLLVYTPWARFSGRDSFTYTAQDASGAVRTALVTVSVTPLAAADTVVTSAGVAVTSDPVANDTGSGLRVAAVDKPAHGSIIVDAEGTLTYTPDAGYSGIETISYTTEDATGQAVSALITISVTPTAAPDAEEVAFGTTVSIHLLSNDLGTGLAVSGFTQPANGTVTVTNAVARYTPNVGFVGFDSFTYTVTDAAGQSFTTTVSLVVPAVSAAPAALAFTGAAPTPIVLLSLFLLLAGCALVIGGRRRVRSHRA